MVKFGLAILIALAALVGAMTFSQEQLLFPTGSVGPADPLPGGASRLSLDRPGEVRLSGVHIPPATASSQLRTLVLGFGGNAWNGDNVATYLHHLYPQAHVVVFHYRGYAPSTGRPSGPALVEDAPLVLDAAVERVRPQRTVAVGFSIGSGVAASLAKSRAIDGLVLVTPFDSLRQVARRPLPVAAGRRFLPQRNRRGRTAAGKRCAGGDPSRRARRDHPGSAHAGASRARFRTWSTTAPSHGAGHNDIYQRADFQQAMREAFAAVTK